MLSDFLVRFAVFLVWDFVVLSAAQLTIRLIMAYSVRQTFVGALALTLIALAIGVVYDLVVGPDPGVVGRLRWLPLAMVLMAIAGFCVARWVLHIKRLRGQLIAGLMVGLLAPHLFTLL